MPRDGAASESEGGAWRSEPRPLGSRGARLTRGCRAHRALPPAPHVAGLEAPGVAFWRIHGYYRAGGLSLPRGVGMDQRSGFALPASELPRRRH